MSGSFFSFSFFPSLSLSLSSLSMQLFNPCLAEVGRIAANGSHAMLSVGMRAVKERQMGLKNR